MLLQKVKLDASNSFLEKLLWLLEDFAAGTATEVQALLDNNIVSRVASLVKEIY